MSTQDTSSGNSPDQSAGSSSYRPIPDEVRQALQDHRLWVKTRRTKDPPRKFPELDLSNLNLSSEQDITFEAADLKGANFSHANLTDVIFAKADLTEANFFGADVAGADFQDANLAGAKLKETNNLNNRLLCRANLAGCELPEDQKNFTGLDYIKDASGLTGQLFFSLMMGCGLAGITVFTTTDVALLTETGTIALPFLGNIINVAWFYIVAPFLLLAMYIYFHLNLQNLWGTLAQLPAVFPDGQRLDQKVYPWLFNWLSTAFFYQLRDCRFCFQYLRWLIATFFAWCFLPLTLLVLWFRYLYMRHAWISWWHLILLAASVFFAAWFLQVAAATLGGRWQEGRLRRLLMNLGVTVITAGLLFGFSFGFMEGIPARLEEEVTKELVPQASQFDAIKMAVPWFLDLFGCSIVLNLEEQEVSIATMRGNGDKKTPRGRDEATARGASLKGRNLRFARARGVFMNRADLRGADLKGAYLRNADLQEVKAGEAGYPMMAADLRCSVLYKANLHKAKLYAADLYKAKLEGANLTECDLEAAVLAEARLDGAHLDGANLKGAILRDAHLQGATLIGVKGLEIRQLKEARGWIFAHYDNTLIARLELHANHDEMVTKKHFPKWNFEGYNFQEIDLSDFNLQEAVLARADMRKANLRDAFLLKGDLTDADLGEADLRGANLSKANMKGVNLCKANLGRTYLKDAKGLQPMQLKSAKNWNLALYDDGMLKHLKLPADHNDRVWSQRWNGYDLRGADFKGVFLVGADFQGADLTGADFSGAELREANLKEAILTNANLTGAFLGKADLRGAKLQGAIFRDANLMAADLKGAHGLSRMQLKASKVDSATKLP